MKILIIFILMLVNSNGITSDIEKYSKAYKVIKDSSIVQVCFSEYYTPRAEDFQICVSDRIYFMDKTFFIDKIIEYEYKYFKNDKTVLREIKDSLYKSEDMLWNKPGNYDNYKVINEINGFLQPKSCDLKLFFSEFDNQNRLCASLIYNYGNEDFRNAYKKSQCGIDYLIYFNEDEIINVIISPFER